MRRISTIAAAPRLPRTSPISSVIPGILPSTGGPPVFGNPFGVIEGVLVGASGDDSTSVDDGVAEAVWTTVVARGVAVADSTAAGVSEGVAVGVLTAGVAEGVTAVVWMTVVDEGVGVIGVGVGVGPIGVAVGVGVGPIGVAVGVSVAAGVGVSVGVAVGVGVGVSVGTGVGVSVGTGVDVSVGAGVGVSVAAAHPKKSMWFVSSVTAPFCASALPEMLAPVFSVMLVRARILPLNTVVTPSVAELPTCQNALQSTPPLISRTDELLAVVSVLPISKVNTAFALPCASNVNCPVNWAEVEKQ